MTTPNDITDLMKALDRNPELDAALPQRLLTQDLLELPDNVAQLTDAVAEMTRVFDQRLTALDSRFDTTDEVLNTVRGQLSNITGADYERKVVRKAVQLARRYLDVQNGEILLAINQPDNATLTNIVAAAVERRAITEQEAYDIYEAGPILAGTAPDGEFVYVVGEISATIDDHDIDRAAARARIMQNASGGATAAAVFGTNVSDANVQHSQDSNVTVIVLNE